MIDTQQLRLGNIVLFNGEPVIVKGIHTGMVFLDGVMWPSTDAIHIEYNPISASEDCLQPLPLSDFLLESLKRARWEDKHGYQHQYHARSANYTIRKDEEGYYIAMFKEDGPIHITPGHFHYYHQLQNIHFAQYGYELGISEDDVRIAWRIVKNHKRI